MPERPTPGPSPGRLVGLYALAVMEREGPLYGYQLAERIAQRTDGSWRPGAGAIYPALESLRARRLARPNVRGRQRVYRITREGRAFLARVRRGIAWRSRGGPDIGPLWSEIAGHEDPGAFLLGRLQHQLDGVTRFLAREAAAGHLRREFRRQLRTELRLAEARTSPPVRRATRPIRRTSRRRP